MPEYLSPGVFVEEVSSRSKSIEGVSTSTTGFTGLASFGPVWYPDGPLNCGPRLITSFTEFERIYGGLQAIKVGDSSRGDERVNYLGHAVQVFFENGGKRVYISRVFTPRDSSDSNPYGFAFHDIKVSGHLVAYWRARWPGEGGNSISVETEVVRSRKHAYLEKDFIQARDVNAGSVIEVISNGVSDSSLVPDGNDALTESNLRVVKIDSEGRESFIGSTGLNQPPTFDDVIHLVEMKVLVKMNNEETQGYEGLAASEVREYYIGKILRVEDPVHEDAPIWFDWDPALSSELFTPAKLVVALQENSNCRLRNGHDGLLPSLDDFMGQEEDPDDITRKATGFAALGEIDDIAIVAIPDSGDMGDVDVSFAIADRLMTHSAEQKYRIAIADGPINSSLDEIRSFRDRFDCSYAALYYPWIHVSNPTESFTQGSLPKQLCLPPSGFVAGIYARNDIERGVQKAPANLVVRGISGLEINIDQGINEEINTKGINALRFFEGRGFRVWGARTMSSDPEWKYVNVRRLMIYIEHSIDKGTQWAVFEPNNSRLWRNIRRTVEDFLQVIWRDGALMGSEPEDAFFVRCDRTTMTQNDLDNGRLVFEVGIAPTKPAEFFIIRITHWTPEA